ncbi:MAG: valine--tRNA ligase [Parcubacteria group bacterium]|nr:valine--tRNA ligase [Parcubacteria group bacterium]
MKQLSKAYEPKNYESKIYSLWERGKFFTPKIAKNKKPFAIIMPPPNANGDLHIGHALFVSLEDIMTRYHRMKGYSSLWLPGADHAGFETQVVFERKLEKEGRSRLQMTREEFYKSVWDFTQKNKKNMEAQLRELGASCDWSRNRFTLDQGIIKIVYQTFQRLYDHGLIYRGERLVNYCTHHQTSFSDLEVKYVERKDPLYYIKYGPFTLATVRPETKFGDTAVAVNPKDKRYQKYIGQEIEIEDVLGKAKLKVIADEAVDPEFGTGVVKVTPAHDMTDWEIGQRHNLEVRSVLDKDGRLNERAGKYAGMKVEEARQAVVEDLKKKGLIEKIDENYTHKVGVCYKCGTVIEPVILPQWFVKTKILAKPAIEAVRKGKIKILPKHFEKTYFHWLRNIKDWNISRQIWWGIPIPAYFCDDCGEIIVEIKKKPTRCPKCGSRKIRQDPDTFDTWFSSGQWPFATLLSFSRKDFEYFYPTSVMETGYEILFFWVARMVMLGIYMTGEIPFRTIYLHGTVRDRYKRKMSKSLGNVVNPIEIINLYGADALRMGLVVGNTPGTDLALDEDKIKGYRNFANKLWNIGRFILMNLNEKTKISKKTAPKTKEDRLILKEERKTIKEMTRLMESFRFYQAGEVIYHYIWHILADKYLEQSKKQLADPKLKSSTQAILHQLLRNSLVMLHPFMPFLTEAIWQEWQGSSKKPLIVENWPK